MTEEEIIEELEKANNQPLDYVQVLIYDHGPNAAPYETWVDVSEPEEDLDDEDCCDGIPLPVQNMSDLLIDLRDGFNLTRVEYKVLEEDDELPVFVLDVVALPTGYDSNITEDVMDKFMEIISNNMEK